MRRAILVAVALSCFVTGRTDAGPSSGVPGFKDGNGLFERCEGDWYACGRTRQGPNAVAGAKRGPRRFKSDPVAGTYDEDIGHISPNSYLFSAPCWQAGYALRAGC